MPTECSDGCRLHLLSFLHFTLKNVGHLLLADIMTLGPKVKVARQERGWAWVALSEQLTS